MWILIINILPAFIVALVFQLLFHEVGHMIAGRLTGWKFLYLQIFRFAFVKHGRFIRLMKMQSTNNQCIMYPRSIEAGAEAYTLGGCFMNLLLTDVSLIFMILWHDDILIWLYSWCFFALGIMLIIMNGLSNTKRICNDMACYQLLKDKNSKLSHNSQLMIAKYLYAGKSYKEIDKKLICLNPERIDNDILAYQAVLVTYFYLDIGHVEAAVQMLEKINLEATISKCISDIIHMELMYLDLIIWFDMPSGKPITNNRYPKGMEAYLDQYESKGDIQSIRVRAVYKAYELCLKGNKGKAELILEDAMNHLVGISCLYEGEKKFCIHQLQSIMA